MAVKEVTVGTKNIQVKPEANVHLTITIGNAQIGGSIVKDETGHIIAKGEKIDIALGNGTELNKKTYTIITNVLDVNKSTNGIVVTHYFHNGEPSTFTHTGKVDDDGDIYSLTTTYKFKL